MNVDVERVKHYCNAVNFFLNLPQLSSLNRVCLS